MNNFKIIYKILKIIEKSMDLEEFDINLLSYEVLGISKTRWKIFFNELVENEYIAGVQIFQVMGSDIKEVKIIRPTLTIKGMEFLEENSLMRKASDIAKGLIDVIN